MEKEYEMQASWREDGDKLTFIACLPPARRPNTDEEVMLEGGERAVDGADRMMGDVNLFVVEDDEDAEQDENKPKDASCIGEIEIMVARADLQGQGMGTSILLTFLWYILTNLDHIVAEYASSLGSKVQMVNMKYLRVKIDAGNRRSIRLFEKAGFVKVSEEANYFNELELRYAIRSKGRDETVTMVLGVEAPKMVVYQLSIDQPSE